MQCSRCRKSDFIECPYDICHLNDNTLQIRIELDMTRETIKLFYLARESIRNSWWKRIFWIYRSREVEKRLDFHEMKQYLLQKKLNNLIL